METLQAVPHSVHAFPDDKCVLCRTEQVGGREFVPSGLINHPKHKDMSGEATFTRLGGAFEDVDEAQLAQAWTERAGESQQA